MPGKTSDVQGTISVNLSQGHIAQKLCPDLIFVDLHMSRYSEMSKRIMAIFKQYDPNMLGASVDEAYLKYVFFSSTSMTGEGNVCSDGFISITVSQIIAYNTTWIQTNAYGGCVSGFLTRPS